MLFNRAFCHKIEEDIQNNIMFGMKKKKVEILLVSHFNFILYLAETFSDFSYDQADILHHWFGH